MRDKRLTVIFFLSFIVLTGGCSSKLSSLLSESWSENYALAIYGSEASHPEITDGKIDTLGVTQPPDRVYTITLPEEKQVSKILIYGGNIISYQLFCWDAEADKWKFAGDVKNARIKKLENYEKLGPEVFLFDHRVKFRTNKIKLEVKRAKSDVVTTTRNPGKNDKILNRREEYLGTGRSRMRLILYDVFVEGPATVREIKVYGPQGKPKVE